MGTTLDIRSEFVSHSDIVLVRSSQPKVSIFRAKRLTFGHTTRYSGKMKLYYDQTRATQNLE